MSDQTNRELARDHVQDVAESCSPEEQHLYATAAITHALLDIADAIRETKTDHTIHVTQHFDANNIAHSIRTHLDGETP